MCVSCILPNFEPDREHGQKRNKKEHVITIVFQYLDEHIGKFIKANLTYDGFEILEVLFKVF